MAFNMQFKILQIKRMQLLLLLQRGNENMVKKNSRNLRFHVAVVGTMSSGKSTLLNAMLGVKILPSRNEACTSKVFRVSDMDSLETFRARGIHRHSHCSSWVPVDGDLLEQWNCGDYREIHVEGNFPHIDNTRRQLGIAFFDTPGPNNSCDEGHAEMTRRILDAEGYALIVCVLNATQFGVDDERDLLESILDAANARGRNARVLFAVNKMDCLDPERGESPVDLMKQVRTYLRDIGYYQPLVVPVMSLLSLRIRTTLSQAFNGQGIALSSRRQRQLVNDLTFHRHVHEHSRRALLHTPRYQQYLARAQAQKREHDRRRSIVLGDQSFRVSHLVENDILTGVPVLEEALEVEMLKFGRRMRRK